MTHDSAKLVDIEGIYVCLFEKTAVILLSLKLRFGTNHKYDDYESGIGRLRIGNRTTTYRE